MPNQMPEEFKVDPAEVDPLAILEAIIRLDGMCSEIKNDLHWLKNSSQNTCFYCPLNIGRCSYYIGRVKLAEQMALEVKQAREKLKFLESLE